MQQLPFFFFCKKVSQKRQRGRRNDETRKTLKGQTKGTKKRSNRPESVSIRVGRLGRRRGDIRQGGQSGAVKEAKTASESSWVPLLSVFHTKLETFAAAYRRVLQVQTYQEDQGS
ncbi:hypothetical protein TEQG_00036 [Trichophyton equinum CBS 127.97]|uniref:Uncharacterized protein n=1 Tax=Trichophyton equinum (strain ATCC MYA-4606 / CBS 127.97) TaxID=559882 RepID=F2PGG3_TRIEC|nr:hypothetical protein TEQG_00036 [Trichophyton equinum CBS 127.97]